MDSWFWIEREDASLGRIMVKIPHFKVDDWGRRNVAATVRMPRDRLDRFRDPNGWSEVPFTFKLRLHGNWLSEKVLSKLAAAGLMESELVQLDTLVKIATQNRYYVYTTAQFDVGDRWTTLGVHSREDIPVFAYQVANLWEFAGAYGGNGGTVLPEESPEETCLNYWECRRWSRARNDSDITLVLGHYVVVDSLELYPRRLVYRNFYATFSNGKPFSKGV